MTLLKTTERVTRIHYLAIIVIYFYSMPVFSQSLSPVWRTTWGDARQFNRVHALYSHYDNEKQYILTITNKNLLKVDMSGNIVKNLQLVNTNHRINCIKQISSGQIIVVYTCEQTEKCSNMLIIIDPNSWSIQKIVPVKMPANNFKITEDTKNNRYILVGTSTKTGPGNRTMILQFLDNSFNITKEINEKSLNLKMPLQTASDLFFDDRSNLFILLTASTNNFRSYIDSIIAMDENMNVIYQLQQRRPMFDNTASGFKFIKTGMTKNNYIMLVSTESKGGGCCQENIYILDKTLKTRKNIGLTGSARYGNELKKTEQGTFLVTSESIGGRGFFTEVDANGQPLFSWISHTEKSWTCATAAIKVNDGYIVALETAFSNKHKKAGTRGIVLIKLTPISI